MVADTGAPGGAGRLRPLNHPRPIGVETDEDGLPVAIHISPGRAGVRPSRRCAVESVLEAWRIDDEWWREHPVSRVYYRLALEDGRTLDVYQDLAGDRWFRQGY